MLKAMLDSLEGISDGDKGHYVEKDGKFFLDVGPVGGWALEDVAGLKTALGTERDSTKKATDSLKTCFCRRSRRFRKGRK